MNKDSRYLTFWKITCCFSFSLSCFLRTRTVSANQLSSQLHTPRQWKLSVNIWTEHYFDRQKGWTYLRLMNKYLFIFSINEKDIYLRGSMRLEFDNFIAWLRVLIHFVLNHFRCRLIISTYQYHGLSKSAAEMKIICVNVKFKSMVWYLYKMYYTPKLLLYEHIFKISMIWQPYNQVIHNKI